MTIVLMVFICAALIWAFWHFAKKIQRDFAEKIAGINARRGLSFPTEPVLGSESNGLLFDRAHRKILFLKCDDIDILEYDYITRWRFEFDVRRNGAVHNRRIVVDTTDFDRPQLIFAGGSETNARNWVARLDVVLNRE